MPDNQQLFVFCSAEIEEVLAYNRSDIPELLAQEGIIVQTGFGNNPGEPGNSGSKEPATVLLASSAVILSLTPILSRILASLTHKTVVTKELICVPVEDSKGNVVKDVNGQPVLHWVERTRIIESAEQRDDTLSIQGPIGIKIAFDDARNNPQRTA